MKIDGREIAESIYADLRTRVGELQKREVTPRLCVILVGEDPASQIYVLQKKIKGEQINAIIDIITYPIEAITDTILNKVRELNADTSVHGIIIQRPLPPQINTDVICEEVADIKDVDGFKSQSPFHVPVVMAVMNILQTICNIELEQGVARLGTPLERPQEAARPRTSEWGEERQDPDGEFFSWLKSKNIVLIGKGDTAGKPIGDYLKEIGTTPQIIDSQTENPQELTKQADIIISSVGKQELIKPDMIKQGVILIGVGISKDAAGKLHGDYEEEAIHAIASAYTPTPGGVGPVNVAMLLHNLVTATEQQI